MCAFDVTDMSYNVKEALGCYNENDGETLSSTEGTTTTTTTSSSSSSSSSTTSTFYYIESKSL